ncbi:MAG: UDP-N-acetylmuramoyl-tripeptide--D-alanyl-D-alanine ligase [Pseudanabaenaceae cyanobacterium SKYGB_i_bin29]|nr:UDP-N-acetylmuramoyl-tripeptide--D-alanyl-D-alanine ligase [Pseudanabaenaceae cyanobacterium SKYG29]MDW8420397.1 UDP-N-acetylmuramoyl-tripeptide--D-alanyl-D-alanine ligase [Pseudanabaenaceae cyanobacterium SKYGB_i_bin29]
MLLTDLIAVTQGTFNQAEIPSQPIVAINTDSRTLQPGQVFVALRGARFDGHDFVPQAIDRGAVVAIVENDLPGYPCLVVENTLLAYQRIARWWRQKSNITVIGVTGSAGKTTTKELISKLLGFYCPPGKTVHYSHANFNNDIGVAKTLLEIKPDRHQFAVIEMAMRGQGEIDRLSSIALPDVAVITNIGTAHIGRLGSKAAIAKAKCEILQHLQGTAVLNGEDELLLSTAKSTWGGKTITYGIDRGDIRGEVQGDYITVDTLTWKLPLPGRHNALNFLAGISVLYALNLDPRISTTAPLELTLPQGRTNLITLSNGIKVLDETYNASPEAVVASLHLLQSIPGRHWAVLGTMKELGEYSPQLHRWVGEEINKLGIYGLVILADEDTKEIFHAATNIPQKFACSTQTEILQLLHQETQPGDVILCKASRSIGLDQLVAQLQQSMN